jgi:predicted O-methyltransferase YrrM
MENQPTTYQLPQALAAINEDTLRLGFDMPSELNTGQLLKTLAASKRNGRLLEIGTGTGLSTAWLLMGMNHQSTLVSLDSDPEVQQIARNHLGQDPRVDFICTDGELWLNDNQDQTFDMIFADAWPGKFAQLDKALNLLALGGIYIIDDLLPQANWPEGHAPKVPALMEAIEAKKQFTSVRMSWASGLMLVTRVSLD